MSKRESKILKDMPHTVVGHSGIPSPRISILLTASGIKELARRTNRGDMVRITRWQDVAEECEKTTYYGRIEIIKK